MVSFIKLYFSYCIQVYFEYEQPSFGHVTFTSHQTSNIEMDKVWVHGVGPWMQARQRIRGTVKVTRAVGQGHWAGAAGY